MNSSLTAHTQLHAARRPSTPQGRRAAASRQAAPAGLRRVAPAASPPAFPASESASEKSSEPQASGATNATACMKAGGAACSASVARPYRAKADETPSAATLGSWEHV